MVRRRLPVRPVTGADTAGVRAHYDDVLSPHYSRLFGDFEAKVADQRSLLERLGVTAAGGDLAVDLGCGSGFQSIALARLGFRVRAIDLSPRLVAELTRRAAGLPVEGVVGDLRDVADLVPAGVALALCMGDTLSHLPHEDDLARVFTSVAARLRAGGRLVLTFRDLSVEARGLDRFVPVCALDDLVVTCFLEYEPRTVKVHDLVWTRQGDGWRFQRSMYRKLRLAPATVSDRLERAGFTVACHDASAGMVALVGVRV
jgi:SAM-dependent methyltransferase